MDSRVPSQGVGLSGDCGWFCGSGRGWGLTLGFISYRRGGQGYMVVGAFRWESTGRLLSQVRACTGERLRPDGREHYSVGGF